MEEKPKKSWWPFQSWGGGDEQAEAIVVVQRPYGDVRGLSQLADAPVPTFHHAGTLEPDAAAGSSRRRARSAFARGALELGGGGEHVGQRQVD